MDASDLVRLHAPRPFPAVSLIMPTHRRRPENRQDPVRLKGLLDQAARSLKQLDLPRGTAEDVMASLEKAADQVDLQRAGDAMVLFAAPGGEQHAFVLPNIAVTERVIIDHTFATRDLAALFEKTWNYWVLVLSEKPTRLWSGEGERLIEVDNALFPIGYTGHGEEDNPDAPRHRTEFFRQVEKSMTEVQKRQPRPIVVLGVSRYLAYLDGLASGPVKDHVIGTVEGSYDHASPSELHDLVVPVLAEAEARWRDEALAELDPARSSRRFAGGLSEVWDLAAEGRIAHLLVEEGYFAAARRTDGHLLPADSDEGEPISDAVDDLVETVLTNDGRVTFVPNDALQSDGRIAAVLRY